MREIGRKIYIGVAILAVAFAGFCVGFAALEIWSALITLTKRGLFLH